MFGESFDSLLYHVALPALLGVNPREEAHIEPIDHQHRHQQRTLLKLVLNHYDTRQDVSFDVAAYLQGLWKNELMSDPTRLAIGHRPDLLVLLRPLLK